MAPAKRRIRRRTIRARNEKTHLKRPFLKEAMKASLQTAKDTLGSLVRTLERIESLTNGAIGRHDVWQTVCNAHPELTSHREEQLDGMSSGGLQRLEPEKILSSSNTDGYFLLVKWKDVELTSFVPMIEIVAKWPEKIIEYLEMIELETDMEHLST